MTFNVNAVKSKRRDGVQIQLLPQNEIGCNRSQAVEQKVQILILKQYSIEPEGVYGKRDEKTRGRQYSGPAQWDTLYWSNAASGLWLALLMHVCYCIMSAPPPVPPNAQEFSKLLISSGMKDVYSYNFPWDDKSIRLFVYSIFFLETLQTALSGADLYYWFASGFGNVKRLTTPYISFFDMPILGSVVSLSVQFFFVYRIRVLGRKRWWWLCILICLRQRSQGGSIGNFASGRIMKIIAMTWLGGNTISDLLIASAMPFHLSRLKSREDGFSNHALVSIVKLTVEANVVTTFTYSGSCKGYQRFIF
ncbi:hypothetical protein V8E52_010674 [Russula decolorans]